jgi:hypothetical protein
MHHALTLQLEPIESRRPDVALNEAADLARRCGVHIRVNVNGTTVRIGPTQMKSAVMEAWSAAKTQADAGR